MSRFIVLYAAILDDPALSDGAKLFYGRLSALSNERGYCYASNAFLASAHGVTERGVKKYLTQLENAGYIERKTVGTQRRVYINFDDRGGTSVHPKGEQTFPAGGNKRSPIIEKDNSQDEKTNTTPRPPYGELHCPDCGR